MAKTLVEVEAQLEEPFALEDIDFLPKGEIERDGKTFCMGMPFADPRVYQDRLNKLVPGEWSTPQPIAIVAGNKLITYVTVVICGVAHTDTGEAFLVNPKSNKPEENTATESWSQAFKRACSHFGLGRFLYSLDKAYLPYNKQYKRIDLDANGLRNEVRKLYVKAGIIANSPNRVQANNGVNVQSSPISGNPTDTGDAIANLFLTTQEVASFRNEWVEAYKVKEQDIEKRWPAFKKFIAKRDVSDDRITNTLHQQMKTYVEQNKAS